MNAPVIIVHKLADTAAYLEDHETRLQVMERRDLRRIAFAAGVGAAVGTLVSGAFTIAAIYFAS